jgi:hypothetical protein
MLERPVRDVKRRLGGPTQGLLGQPHLLLAQRRAVRFEGVLLVRRAVPQVRAHQDERGTLRLGAGGAQGALDSLQVVAVGDRLRVPAVGLEAPGAVLGERDLRRSGQRDAVIVVQVDQLAEPEMAGQRCSLRRHAFHQIAVAGDGVGVVIDDLKPGAIVARGEIGFGDGHAHAVAEALAERPRRRLDAGRAAALGVAGRLAAPLPELLDLFERQVIAGEVQQTVQQHGPVTGGKNEAVAVKPVGMGRIVFEEACPEDICHGRGAQRQSGVSAVGLLHRVDGQETDGIDS